MVTFNNGCFLLGPPIWNKLYPNIAYSAPTLEYGYDPTNKYIYYRFEGIINSSNFGYLALFSQKSGDNQQDVNVITYTSKQAESPQDSCALRERVNLFSPPSEDRTL